MKKYLCFITVLLIVSGSIGAEGVSIDKHSSANPTYIQEQFYWYENGVKKRAWMSARETAIFPMKGKDKKIDKDFVDKNVNPKANITKKNRFITYIELPEPVNKQHILGQNSFLRNLPDIKQASPVFFRGNHDGPTQKMVLTGEILVQFASAAHTVDEIEAVEQEYGLIFIQEIKYGETIFFLYEAGNPFDSLNISNELVESGIAINAYPNWLRERAKRSIPDDLLFSDQWHLYNTGQGGGISGEDVNIISVWDTYTATSSEVIAIVDDGLEVAHEDLAPNIIAGQSWDYVDGDSDPTAGDHGTSCAGVAAAKGFNSIGVTGAASSAGLVGYRLLGAGTDVNEADALTRNYNTIDIYSNSWGPEDDGRRLEGPGPLTGNALMDGITNGRGGLGTIYVWAGGNGYDADNSNYDGYANNRFTIAIAASDNSGIRSSYSEKGANILVNAPSNGGSLGITTTDRTGPSGYSFGNYTDSFGGTSSAAPLVSGIIALILEANPGLTWRDVQHILIETAERNDPSDSGWSTNGAGHYINHKYGFGRIDAQAAVNASESWNNVNAETNVEYTSNPNLAIPDNNSVGVTDSLSITEDVSIESIEIYLSASDHTYWGALEVTLTSPDGTESVLAEYHGSSGISYVYDNWRFGSLRHFGESSQGTWTLKVADLDAYNDTGTFQSWTLKVYGCSDSYYRDSDGDGYGDVNDSVSDCSQPNGYVSDSTDCNDSNPVLNPETIWYPDTDGDSYGDQAVPLQQCTQPTGPPDHVLNNTDYDDNDPDIGAPAKIGAITPSSYLTLQEAYDAAVEGDTIQSIDVIFNEDLVLAVDKTVTLKGGYDGDYLIQSGDTRLEGSIDITNGTLTIENFILQ